jgi:RHS repeat-associated protein
LYTNSFNETGWSWWHLFTVQQVIETDLVGGSPPVVHAYSYASTGSTTVKWAHDDGSAVWGSSMPYRSWSNWRGWARVTVKTGTASSGPRSQVATTYFRGLHGDLADSSGATRSVNVTDVHASTWIDYPYKAGQVMQQVTHDTAEGDPVQVTRFRYERHITGTRTLSTDWAIPNVHTSVIGRTQAQERWDWDPAAEDWTRFEGIRWRWDAGNGRLDSTSDVYHDTCVRYEYADNTSLRLLDRVSRKTTNVNTCDLAAGDLLADQRYFYDGLATHGATPTVGDVTQTQVYDGTGWFTVSQAGFDGYGRVVSASDGLGRETTTGYIHNSDRQLVETQVTNPAGHVTTTVLEPGRGLPVQVSDPNGKVTTAEYDPAGRLVAVWAPGHPTTGTPTAAYEYTVSKTAPSWVETKILGPNGNQIVSYDIFDGLLRPRQAQATAPDGNRVITDTAYNHRGQPGKVSTFYNDTSGPTSTLVTFSDSAVDRQVRYVYDGQGRQTQQQQWSQDSMLFTHATTYGYRNVLSVPPTGGTVTRELFNELGLTVAQRTYHTVNPTGSYDETSHTYDWLDRLVTVSDPGANTWTYTYNMAGRLVQTTDPDAAATTTAYDQAGQKTSVTDARGMTLAYDYDQLGRTTGIYQDNLAGTLLAGWEHDTVQLGQLTSSTRHDGGLAYVREVTGYDDAYRPTATKVTIPTSTGNGQLAGTYQEQMTYHTDGSIASRTLPPAGGLSAETLTYTYTNTGLLDTMTGGDDYLAGITYRWDGSIAETLHGQDDQQVRQSYAYDEATGRLETSQVDTEDPQNPGVFLDGFTTTHTYDNAGNILAMAGRTAGTVDQVECFDYDHLRRLVEAWTQNTETCGTPQATGADAYHRNWTFDPTGNRLTQTDHDTTAGNTVWTYDVGATHNVTPHQVAEVTATGPKAGTASRVFDYDQAGNVIAATSESGAAQTLTWTAQGQLEALIEGTDVTTYVYDADGTRLLARNPDSTVLYLGSTQIEELSGGTVAATRYYDNTAVRTPTGLVWTATDRNQTSTIQIDATTLQAERRRLLPYGEPRGTQPSSWAGTKGYVGGTTDPTGLTHLGARYYDPSLGRFTSLDPIIAHGDTQQMHGYTYANNNPILYSDPTGLFFTEDNNGKGLKGFITKTSTGTKTTITGTVDQWAGSATGPSERSDPKSLNDIALIASQVLYHELSPWRQKEIQRMTWTHNNPAAAAAYNNRDFEILGQIIRDLVGITDIQDCANGSIGGCAWFASNFVPIGGKIKPVALAGARLLKASFKVADDVPWNGFCSFTADTHVLMADHTTTPISDLQPGDLIWATDPETGREGPRPVQATWTHQDTVIDLELDNGATITTTEDHPFWNHTDQQWQQTQHLNPGDHLHTPDTTTTTVTAIHWNTTHTTTAYNLTIADIHTYYVIAGTTPVLVHNCNRSCWLILGQAASSRSRRARWLVRRRSRGVPVQ